MLCIPSGVYSTLLYLQGILSTLLSTGYKNDDTDPYPLYHYSYTTVTTITAMTTMTTIATRLRRAELRLYFATSEVRGATADLEDARAALTSALADPDSTPFTISLARGEVEDSIGELEDARETLGEVQARVDRLRALECQLTPSAN